MSSEDKSWVFDSLVGFLKGPMWNGPINSFVEQKSIFFEAEETTTEEHRQIHNEYKNLVDYMLGTYMEEMGITPAEFENACCEPTGEIEAKLHQTLFEQIWAANDIEIFHQMMTEKNLDLQLQALDMIQTRFGITPQSFVLNFSPKRDRCERALEKKVVQLSLDNDDPENDISSQRLSPHNEDATVHKKADQEGSGTASFVVGKGKSRRSKQIPTVDHNPETEETGKGTQPDSLFLAEEKLQKRKEYLKSQRDKIVEMKRQERGQTLKNTCEDDMGEIPQASTADTSDSFPSGNFDINPQTLKIRKALAKRLKDEVIKKTPSSTE